MFATFVTIRFAASLFRSTDASKSRAPPPLTGWGDVGRGGSRDGLRPQISAAVNPTVQA